MGKVLTERDVPPDEFDPPAIPVHDPDLAERVRDAAARSEAEADTENGQGDDADTPEGEGEGEGQGDGPSAETSPPTEAPPFDPLTKECPICEGWGIVRTHSDVEGEDSRKCWRCRGMGYLARQPEPEDPDNRSAWQPPEPAMTY